MAETSRATGLPRDFGGVTDGPACAAAPVGDPDISPEAWRAPAAAPLVCAPAARHYLGARRLPQI